MGRPAGVFVALVLLFAPRSSSALTLGFDCVSGHLAADCALGEAQLRVEVGAGPEADQVRFDFTNTARDGSSLTDVYFDDGADLLAFALLLDGAGVDFEAGARPSRLPGGSAVAPGFDTTFGADAEAPTAANGVGLGETLGIVFDLRAGQTLSDVTAALGDGRLRIGLHVQGFGRGGGSESFVNAVPEPRAAWLLAAGLLGRWLWRRRRARGRTG